MARVKNGSKTPAIVILNNFDCYNVSKMGVADIYSQLLIKTNIKK